MADAVWPPSLPAEALLAGLEETPPELRLRTAMDAGPAKVRRRFTAGVRVFSVSLLLTRAQVQTFDEFLLTTVEGGSLPFTWKHPRTGNPIDFRFVELPRYAARAPRQLAGDYWSLSFTLEALPGTEVTDGGGGDPEDPDPPDDQHMLSLWQPWGWDFAAPEPEAADPEEEAAAIDVLIFEAAPGGNDELVMLTSWYPIETEADPGGIGGDDEFGQSERPGDAGNVDPTAPIGDPTDSGGIGVGGGGVVWS